MNHRKSTTANHRESNQPAKRITPRRLIMAIVLALAVAIGWIGIRHARLELGGSHHDSAFIHQRVWRTPTGLVMHKLEVAVFYSQRIWLDSPSRVRVIYSVKDVDGRSATASSASGSQPQKPPIYYFDLRGKGVEVAPQPLLKVPRGQPTTVVDWTVTPIESGQSILTLIVDDDDPAPPDGKLEDEATYWSEAPGVPVQSEGVHLDFRITAFGWLGFFLRDLSSMLWPPLLGVGTLIPALRRSRRIRAPGPKTV